jgi:hypothetical protein
MLTPAQTKQIQYALSIRNAKRLKDPLLRHQFLLHWNFDDGLKPLRWLIDQPDTDLGTVVLLYWLLGPGHLHAHPDDPAHDLIRAIEANVTAGYYINRQIAVDPAADMGSNFLAEPANRDNLASIPPALQARTPGEPVVMEKLANTYVDKIYDLNDKDRIKLDREITKGMEALRTFAPAVSAESAPEAIVSALNAYVNAKRPPEGADTVKFDRKQTNVFKALDLLFGAQLVRQAGWKWHIHEMREQVLDFREFVLVSADGKYEWHPFGGYLAGCADRAYTNTRSVIDDFQDLCDIPACVARNIRDRFAYKRTQPDYAGKTDAEIEAILTREAIDYWRTNRNHADRYEDAPDAQILAERRHDIYHSVYGHPLPHHVKEIPE